MTKTLINYVTIVHIFIWKMDYVAISLKYHKANN